MAEEIILETHPTRLAYMKLYLAALLLTTIWGVLYFNPTGLDLSFLSGYRNATLILPALGILFAGASEVMIRVETYTFTNYRIKVRRGIINVHEASITWEMVGDVELRQNVLERVLSIGTIFIESVGGGPDPEAVMKNVRNAKQTKEMIIERMLGSKEGDMDTHGTDDDNSTNDEPGQERTRRRPEEEESLLDKIRKTIKR